MTDISAVAEFIVEASQTLGSRSLPDGALDAQRIPGRADAFVAVAASRELFLLLEVGEETQVDERRLKALRVLTGDDFTIVDARSSETFRRRFAVVALRPDNPDLVFSFAVVAASLLSTLPISPSATDVVGFLDSLVDLVAPQRAVTASTVVGLWGELWIILKAEEPIRFAAAWHNAPEDRYDFSFPESRLEVKTTTGPTRLHEFSLEQLAVGDAKPTLLASVQILSDPSGSSIFDLLEAVVQVLPGDLGAKVTRIALNSLSGDLESIQDFTFAPMGAEPVYVFPVSDIPRPQVAEGSGVTGVRFRVDLDRLGPLARSTQALTSLLNLEQ